MCCRLVLGDVLLRYDKNGDYHYDIVSAFIKSMRGSDPDAALHYLARLIESGEDVRFIARRIVICAAEDVGNADPMALVVANNSSPGSTFYRASRSPYSFGTGGLLYCQCT